jgi:hypothetical protein
MAVQRVLPEDAMSDTSLTVKLDEFTSAQFAQAAQEHGMSEAELLASLVRDFLIQRGETPEYDAWFRQEIALSREEADRGEVLSAEEAEAEAETWVHPVRSK